MSEVDDCWNRIGVYADHSCPELVAHVHCRSCPVFGRAGRHLLEQRSPAGYVDEWTRIVATPKEATASGSRSVLVFRVGAEWLAIDTRVCVEVSEQRPVHRIAHRADGHLAGLVNIRGVLHLCIALRGLLQVEPGEPDPRARPRLVVLRSDRLTWVIPADDVSGIHHYGPDQVHAVPDTVQRGVESFARGVVRLDGRTVGHLDDARLFAAFDRCVE